MPPDATPSAVKELQVHARLLSVLFSSLDRIAGPQTCVGNLNPIYPPFLAIHVRLDSRSSRDDPPLTDGERNSLLTCIEAIVNLINSIDLTDDQIIRARDKLVSLYGGQIAAFQSRRYQALSAILPPTAGSLAIYGIRSPDFAAIQPEKFHLWLRDIRSRGFRLAISDPLLAAAAASRLPIPVEAKRMSRPRQSSEYRLPQIIRLKGEPSILIAMEVFQLPTALLATATAIEKTIAVSRYCHGVFGYPRFLQLDNGPMLALRCRISDTFMTIDMDGLGDISVLAEKASEIVAVFRQDNSPLLGSPYIAIFKEVSPLAR